MMAGIYRWAVRHIWILCFLVVLLTVVILLISAAAEISDRNSRIVSFEGMEPAPAVSVEIGTDKADIPLPEKLTAVLTSGEQDAEGGTYSAEVPVTWECNDYDAEMPGTYTFTARFQEYDYPDAHPIILVTAGNESEEDKAADALYSNCTEIERFCGNTIDNLLIRVYTMDELPEYVGVILADGTYVNIRVTWHPLDGNGYRMHIEDDYTYAGEFPCAYVTE